SKRFYTELLGFTVISETHRAERNSWKLDLALHGIYCIELFSFPNPPMRVSNPEALGLRHLAFKVDNLDKTMRELEKSGVEFEKVRKDELRGNRFVFFRDPDGLPLELCEI